MFNLVPDIVKEKILKDYGHRRFVVWLFGMLMCMMIFFIFLLPTYAYILLEEKNTLADTILIKNSLQLKEADQVVGTIKETNEQLKALGVSGNPTTALLTLEKVGEAKNPLIHVNEIEYEEDTASTSILILRGIADKRDALREFVSKLESTESFFEVLLPVSNFAKDKDIEFSINVKIR